MKPNRALQANRFRSSALAVTMAAGTFATASASAYALPKSGIYDQVESIVSPRLTIKTSSHLTFKGDKFRLESEGQDFIPYDDIVDGQSLYHYVPLANEAARNDLPKNYLSPIAVLQQQTQRILQGATKTGETTVGDIDCTTYTLTFPDGGKGTFYQDKDPKFPFFIKEIIIHPDRQVVDTTTFENLKLDVAVPDSTFTLPTGTKIDQAPPPGDQPGSAPAPGTTGAAAPSASGGASGTMGGS